MEMCGEHHAPAAFPPGKNRYPLYYEAGWAPGPVWTGAEDLIINLLNPSGFFTYHQV